MRDEYICPKCAGKMTLLLVSAVCDRCEPPKKSANDDLRIVITGVQPMKGIFGQTARPMTPVPKSSSIPLAYNAGIVWIPGVTVVDPRYAPPKSDQEYVLQHISNHMRKITTLYTVELHRQNVQITTSTGQKFIVFGIFSGGIDVWSQTGNLSNPVKTFYSQAWTHVFVNDLIDLMTKGHMMGGVVIKDFFDDVEDYAVKMMQKPAGSAAPVTLAAPVQKATTPIACKYYPSYTWIPGSTIVDVRYPSPKSDEELVIQCITSAVGASKAELVEMQDFIYARKASGSNSGMNVFKYAKVSNIFWVWSDSGKLVINGKSGLQGSWIRLYDRDVKDIMKYSDCCGNTLGMYFDDIP